ncbi:MAG: urease subunit gamma [Betaproteobacteria bacterium]
MHLNATELERLTLITAAEMARRNRSQGKRLSHAEAVALISDEVLSAARKGAPHADLVEYGRSLLTTDDVEPGVESLIPFVRLEACLTENGRRITVLDPIKPGRGLKTNPGGAAGPGQATMERERISLDVLNTSDRVIQVRSHAHFYEVHHALKFDRQASLGTQLDRPAGASTRFEPGEIARVTLVRNRMKPVVGGLSDIPASHRKESDFNASTGHTIVGSFES